MTAVLASDCFHCGLPVPAGVQCEVQIDGVSRSMCCPGCRAVAELILDQGLVDYYRHRETPGPRIDDALAETLVELRIFDDESVQSDFVHDSDDAGRSATLSIEGMRCAACAWLIERRLCLEPGVESAHVSLTNHRAQVRWRPEVTELSDLLFAIDRIGYRARPFEPDRDEGIHREENRRALQRLGIAGLAMAQVMMFSIALYAGAIEGMAPSYRDLMRGVSALVTTVVIFTASRPFFEGALRDLRARHLGMDVPIALALGAAYLASVVATVTRSGEVYFDSVCMFTFFLTLARYLELRIRARSGAHLRSLARRIPRTARRWVDGAIETVPCRLLERGDVVQVPPGESVPVDGRVIEGESSVSESLLTGEFEPRAKRVGDAVMSGSQNIDGLLTLRVEQAGAGNAISTILRLLDRAASEKPAIATLADRVARSFVAAILVVACGVALVWWQLSPADAFWITLSVLVVTCPCALSLATPAALAAATNGLASRGFLITRGHTLETLADIDHVIFDKTGTVTTDTPRLDDIVPIRAIPTVEVLAIANALEGPSLHPLARAIRTAASGMESSRKANRELDARMTQWVSRLSDPAVVPNCGVRAQVAEATWWLGRPDWVMASLASATETARDCDSGGGPQSAVEPPAEKGTWLLLADDAGAVAWLGFSTELRADARSTLAALRQSGVESWLVSGDPSSTEVASVAAQLGIERFIANASPEDKLSVLSEIQRGGGIVAAAGDGVNDAPVLGQAHVAIAMGCGADLAQVNADAVLLGDGIQALDIAVQQARKTRRIIRQNLGWALVYNLTALPLAACGYVPPWAAALGMSVSSLVVVGNALRLANANGNTNADAKESPWRFSSS